MKDRIRQLMASQHMSQQVFADFVGIAPATLSGIFNDRTRPTINIVEAIKKKIPSISTDWLLFGTGTMYAEKSGSDVASPSSSSSLSSQANQSSASASGSFQETLFGSDPSVSPAPSVMGRPSNSQPSPRYSRQDMEIEFMKNYDKTPRRVTEIRVFYDDQTWESFVPAKK